MDYRVRGFTRDVNGEKLFMDHEINSIQDYIANSTLEKYEKVDINVKEANLFHTKMLLKELELKNYLFNKKEEELSIDKRNEIKDSLRKEMLDIYYGQNIK